MYTCLDLLISDNIFITWCSHTSGLHYVCQKTNVWTGLNRIQASGKSFECCNSGTKNYCLPVSRLQLVRPVNCTLIIDSSSTTHDMPDTYMPMFWIHNDTTSFACRVCVPFTDHWSSITSQLAARKRRARRFGMTQTMRHRSIMILFCAFPLRWWWSSFNIRVEQLWNTTIWVPTYVRGAATCDIEQYISVHFWKVLVSVWHHPPNSAIMELFGGWHETDKLSIYYCDYCYEAPSQHSRDYIHSIWNCPGIALE